MKDIISCWIIHCNASTHVPLILDLLTGIWSLCTEYLPRMYLCLYLWKVALPATTGDNIPKNGISHCWGQNGKAQLELLSLMGERLQMRIWNQQQHDCIAKLKLTKEEEKNGRTGLGQCLGNKFGNQQNSSFLFCRTRTFSA